MGDVLGYARVSTGDQDVAGQAMRPNLPVKRAVQLVPTGHRCAGPELAPFPATIHP